ncbi:hypothetical protein CEG14_14865 [Bordetella genomosp. 1]|uniref:Phage gp6-like head-tail connector protein n=1 Tax=Bordetella genomosp. 1 TaxID=1395607 RepID=A0A261SGW8_9BORD|nr:head-tail connector protein [Bordetella genomosp. 1]OZI36291.1 hypothetical protein CEG14_14865 [Bordetella genomosp. 1]
MAAVLLEFLAAEEPLSVDQVKLHCKIDHDDEDLMLSSIVIPAARQLAEARTGAALRMARYREQLPSLTNYPLSLGQVVEICELNVGGKLVPAAAYTLADLGTEARIDAPGYGGLSGVVTYRAGVEDFGRIPSVVSWMLLACGWMYKHRALLAKGEAVQEMPRSFTDSLLLPVTQPRRF